MASNVSRCRWIDWSLLASPLVLLASVAGASVLGLDADGRWGPFQSGIFGLGLIGTLAVAGFLVAEHLDTHLVSSGEYEPRSTDIRAAGSLSRLRWILPVLVVVGVALLYIFFISVGHWSPWPSSTQYYDQQAEAFLQGRLDLPTQPDPALGELENPYDPQERGSIPIEFDASYYEGKYFLYWGPAPALIAGAWKWITGVPVGDEHVTFLAVNVLFLFSVLILLQLRARYFPSLPTWLLTMSVAFVGVVHPLLWWLNWPTIYPAAIACGQAFLVAGLFFAIPILQFGDQSKWRYLLVGVLWALAVASRITVFASLSILAGTLVYWNIRSGKFGPGLKQRLSNVALFVGPLALSTFLLALYNYLRFGSLLEFGLRFQLSKLNTFSLAASGQLFDIRYLAPNIIHYLLAPLRLQPGFPFIRPLLSAVDSVEPISKLLRVPEVHRVENASGILFTAPVLIFCAYVLRETICTWGLNRGAAGVSSGKAMGPQMKGEFLGFMSTVILAGLMGFLPILLYFWVTNRFLGDVVPLLSLGAVAGMWMAYSVNKHHRWLGAYLRVLLICLVVYSMLVGLLLAFTGTFSSFDDRNPELWRWLEQLFSI